MATFQFWWIFSLSGKESELSVLTRQVENSPKLETFAAK
jgi:hypothetical protein